MHDISQRMHMMKSEVGMCCGRGPPQGKPPATPLPAMVELCRSTPGTCITLAPVLPWYLYYPGTCVIID